MGQMQDSGPHLTIIWLYFASSSAFWRLLCHQNALESSFWAGLCYQISICDEYWARLQDSWPYFAFITAFVWHNVCEITICVTNQLTNHSNDTIISPDAGFVLSFLHHIIFLVAICRIRGANVFLNHGDLGMKWPQLLSICHSNSWKHPFGVSPADYLILFSSFSCSVFFIRRNIVLTELCVCLFRVHECVNSA